MGKKGNLDLVAVSGSSIAPPQVSNERKAAADQIRLRVTELRDKVAESYFEIGRHLHTIQKEALYKLWGYETFSAYVDEEVTFKWRKAMYLMKIYRYFALELNNDSVFDKVKPLGISKAAALTDVVTEKNADKWVEKAEKLSVAALEDEVRRAKEAKKLRAQQRKDAEDQRRDTEAAEREEDRKSRQGNAVYDGQPSTTGDPIGDGAGVFGGDSIDPVSGAEDKEIRSNMTVRLTKDQKSNIEAACRTASYFIDDQKTNTEKEKNHDAKGYLLDFVATGFLAFHGSTVRENIRKHSANLRNDTLAAFERAFGLRIIAVSAESADVMYGIKHVDALTQALAGEDGAE
jgi:hypothetical protein